MSDAPHTRPITVLSAEETLPLRRAVLWPSLTLSGCRVEGDAQARHYGVEINNEIVCCFSVFDVGENLAQICKFATAEQHQGKGYGGYLLNHVLESLEAENIVAVVLDARLTAVAFYKKHGFVEISEIFVKSGIENVKMERRLTSA